MLLTHQIARAVAAGEVTVAYRRWAKPRVAPGSTFRTVAGTVRIEAIDLTYPEQLNDVAAQNGGYATLEQLLASLRGTPSTPLWKITLAWEGPDLREALAQDTALVPSDIDDIDALLARLDARTPWTRATLHRMAENPGITAARLTDGLPIGKESLKRRIRSLKEHGLTQSLPAGYELSARGHAYLVAPIGLARLESALRQSWGPDTCAPEDQADWRPDNPARGQCITTVLVVHDERGGELVRGDVHLDGEHVDYHWWNRLPDGTEVDLTREQFSAHELTSGGTGVARPVDNGRVVEQYGRLRARVDDVLGRDSGA